MFISHCWNEWSRGLLRWYDLPKGKWWNVTWDHYLSPVACEPQR
jgi:hypothetical protein